MCVAANVASDVEIVNAGAGQKCRCPTVLIVRVGNFLDVDDVHLPRFDMGLLFWVLLWLRILVPYVGTIIRGAFSIPLLSFKWFVFYF